MAKNYLIGIDIGSYYTKSILFEVSPDGSYIPIASDKKITDGIVNGEIQDISALNKTIKSVIANFSDKLGKRKESEIVVGYSTNNLNISQEVQAVEFTSRTEIKEEDLHKIKKNIVNKYNEEGKMVLDISFMKFIVDGKVVKNPVSFYVTNSLNVTLNIVWVNENAFALLKNVFKDIVDDSQFPIYDTTLGLCYTATSSNDRNVGVAVLDLGYYQSRIITFKNGMPKLFYSFPYGIKYVLKDISNVLKVPENEANRLLCEQALCMKDTKTVKKVDIRLISGGAVSYTSQNLLNKIVYARTREILNRLNGEIAKFSYEKAQEVGALFGGIVYTGGGAKIKNIDAVLRELVGDNFRSGKLSSNMFVNLAEKYMDDPDLLGVFGIVDRYRFDKAEIGNREQTPVKSGKPQKQAKGGFFNKLIDKIAGGDDDAI